MDSTPFALSSTPPFALSSVEGRGAVRASTLRPCSGSARTGVESSPRIVIIGVNWLGDTLFMTPAIRALRRRYPAAFIACAVPPRCRELLAGNPHLDLVMPFDERGDDRGVAGLRRFAATLRAQRFETCFLFHRSFTRALCAAWAGIPRRIGYATWKRAWLLTTAVPMPPKDTVHKAELWLRLLEIAGVPRDGLHYDLTITAKDQEYAQQLLREAVRGSAVRPEPDPPVRPEPDPPVRPEPFGTVRPEPDPPVRPEPVEGRMPIIALHAGANWALKRWPPARFARLGDELAESHQARVVLVGAADDRPMAEGIARRMRHPPAILCGQTTLPQLGALFTQVSAVISNDSGPLHLASAVGARAVGLFGPTKPELTAPPQSPTLRILFGSVGCPVPCYRQWCPINLCLRQISPEQVAHTVAELIEDRSW